MELCSNSTGDDDDDDDELKHGGEKDDDYPIRSVTGCLCIKRW
jgi:hypothetical protein